MLKQYSFSALETPKGTGNVLFEIEEVHRLYLTRMYLAGPFPMGFREDVLF